MLLTLLLLIGSSLLAQCSTRIEVSGLIAVNGRRKVYDQACFKPHCGLSGVAICNSTRDAFMVNPDLESYFSLCEVVRGDNYNDMKIIIYLSYIHPDPVDLNLVRLLMAEANLQWNPYYAYIGRITNIKSVKAFDRGLSLYASERKRVTVIGVSRERDTNTTFDSECQVYDSEKCDLYRTTLCRTIMDSVRKYQESYKVISGCKVEETRGLDRFNVTLFIASNNDLKSLDVISIKKNITNKWRPYGDWSYVIQVDHIIGCIEISGLLALNGKSKEYDQACFRPGCGYSGPAMCNSTRDALNANPDFKDRFHSCKFGRGHNHTDGMLTLCLNVDKPSKVDSFLLKMLVSEANLQWNPYYAYIKRITKMTPIGLPHTDKPPEDPSHRRLTVIGRAQKRDQNATAHSECLFYHSDRCDLYRFTLCRTIMNSVRKNATLAKIISTCKVEDIMTRDIINVTLFIAESYNHPAVDFDIIKAAITNTWKPYGDWSYIVGVHKIIGHGIRDLNDYYHMWLTGYAMKGNKHVTYGSQCGTKNSGSCERFNRTICTSIKKALSITRNLDRIYSSCTVNAANERTKVNVSIVVSKNPPETVDVRLIKVLIPPSTLPYEPDDSYLGHIEHVITANLNVTSTQLSARRRIWINATVFVGDNVTDLRYFKDECGNFTSENCILFRNSLCRTIMENLGNSSEFNRLYLACRLENTTKMENLITVFVRSSFSKEIDYHQLRRALLLRETYNPKDWAYLKSVRNITASDEIKLFDPFTDHNTKRVTLHSIIMENNAIVTFEKQCRQSPFKQCDQFNTSVCESVIKALTSNSQEGLEKLEPLRCGVFSLRNENRSRVILVLPPTHNNQLDLDLLPYVIVGNSIDNRTGKYYVGDINVTSPYGIFDIGTDLSNKSRHRLMVEGIAKQNGAVVNYNEKCKDHFQAECLAFKNSVCKTTAEKFRKISELEKFYAACMIEPMISQENKNVNMTIFLRKNHPETANFSSIQEALSDDSTYVPPTWTYLSQAEKISGIGINDTRKGTSPS